MVKMSQREQLEKMEDGMAKQILTKILNTPKPDYEKMDRECEEYTKAFLAALPEEIRNKYLSIK